MLATTSPGKIIYHSKEVQKIFTPADAARCEVDPVFFINKYAYTFDPRPEAPRHDLPFRLYDYQEDLVKWVLAHINGSKDVFIEKSRDMGASWVVLALILWCWIYKPGFQALVGSRVEDYVDDGTTQSLFGKFDYILHRLPFWPKGFTPDKHRTYMKLTNPENGNVIKGESANANFSRQGRFTLVFFDEFAFWESPETAWTAAGEATRCRLAVTTPPKSPNFVSALRDLIVDQQISIAFKTLHWKLHPHKDEAWYEAQRARKTATELAREIDINWQGALTGRVYPEIEHVRLGDFPYRPDWPLYVSHDPGHDPDPYALTWWQVNPENGRFRLVEAFEKNKAIVDWYAPLFGHPISAEFAYTPEELTLINTTQSWRPAIHYGDPAIRQGNVVSGYSARQAWSAKYNIIVQSNTKANDLQSRKQETQQLLTRLDANNTPRVRYWMKCLQNAHYPELGENSQRVTENTKPVHDWTSHLRTSTEYFAVNYKLEIREPEVPGMTFNKAAAMLDAQRNRTHYLT